MSPVTAADGLSTILVNVEENYGNWKISKTGYDFIKAEKVLETKLMRKLDARMRKEEKYLEEPTSVILKRFPKNKDFRIAELICHILL